MRFFFKKIAEQKGIHCFSLGLLYSTVKPDKNHSTKFKIKSVIKDMKGEILKNENVQTIDITYSIQGLKEALPHLPLNEPVTLYIHPKWALAGNDRQLGDKLLIFELIIEQSF